MGWESAIRRLARTDWGEANPLAQELRAIFADISANGVEGLILNPTGDEPAITVRQPVGGRSTPVQVNTGPATHSGGGAAYTGLVTQTPATAATTKANVGQLTNLSTNPFRRLDTYTVTDPAGNEVVAVSPPTLRGPETDAPSVQYDQWPGYEWPPRIDNPDIAWPDFTPGDLSITVNLNTPPGTKHPPGSDNIPPPGQKVTGENDPGGSNSPNAWPAEWPDNGGGGGGTGGIDLGDLTFDVQVDIDGNTVDPQFNVLGAPGAGETPVTVIGRVVSGAGDTYVVDVWGKNPAEYPAMARLVTTVPQIDPDEVIPAGTYLYVVIYLKYVRATQSSQVVAAYAQPPVFLAALEAG